MKSNQVHPISSSEDAADPNQDRGQDGGRRQPSRPSVFSIPRSLTEDDTAEQAIDEPDRERRVSITSKSSNWSTLTAGLMERTEKRKALAEIKEKRQKEYLRRIQEGKLRNRVHSKSGRHNKCLKFLRRFKTLCWGKMFFRHRYLIVTLFEVIFAPLLCVAIFIAFTQGVTWRNIYYENHEATKHAVQYKPFNVQDMKDEFLDRESVAYNRDNVGRIYLVYAPKTQFTTKLMEGAMNNLGITEANKVDNRGINNHFTHGYMGVDDTREVLEHCFLHRKDLEKHGKPIGVVFDFDGKKSKSARVPEHLTFSISTFHEEIADTTDSHPFTPPPMQRTWKSPYHKYGFLGLQASIEDSYIEMVKNEEKIANHSAMDLSDLIEKSNRRLHVRFFPNFFNATARILISIVITIVLVIGYTSTSYFLVQQIVVENNSRIKDLLQLHSMPYYFHWIILLTNAFIFRTITASLVTGALFVDYGKEALVHHSDPSLVFFMIEIHLLSLTCFNFFLATIQTSEQLSGAIAVGISVLSYIFPALLERSGFIGYAPNFILCFLFPNWALKNFIRLLIEFECNEEGLNWNNFAGSSTKHNGEFEETPTHPQSFRCASLIIKRQKKMESDLKWYECIEKCQRLRKLRSAKDAFLMEAEDTIIDDNYERPPIYEDRNLETDKCEVSIRCLSKVYGKHRLVLDRISMNFAHGEITVILGHTDSGKTTLLHCLAGVTIPTTGVITINGFNVITEAGNARRDMGICPQKIVTFNLLTVQEHLLLCLKLRGLDEEDANHESGQLIKLLRLHESRDRVPSEITSDEKRKLAMAMCLVDKPNVLFFDQPTLGMDVIAKKEIWTIIKRLKAEGRTIIMTTNMMDEAEALGDRVALLVHSKLLCYGSPDFLKKQYDAGYILRIVPAFKFFMDKLNEIAIKHFSEPLKERKLKAIEDKKNILLNLPLKRSKFGDFLNEMEQQKFVLGIFSYEVEQISLSDVFIKVCETVNSNAQTGVTHARAEFMQNIYQRKASGTDEWASALASQLPELSPDEKSKPSKTEQFCALIRKQWIYTKSRSWVVLWEYCIPLIFILLAVLEADIFVIAPGVPRIRRLELASFPEAQVPIKIHRSSLGVDWKQVAHLVLGKHKQDFSDSKDDITEFLNKDFERDKANNNFSIERRMMSIEIWQTPQKIQCLTGHFSSASLHSAPTILSILGNMVLQALVKAPATRTNRTYKMTAINAPFPSLSDDVSSVFHKSCSIRCVVFAMIVSLAVGFMAATISNMPFEEMHNGMKQVQIMAGVHPAIYWLSNYTLSFIIFAIMSILIVFIFSLDWFGDSVLESRFKMVLFLFIFLYLCWSSIPWIFFLTTILPKKLSTYSFVMLIHFAFGIVPYILLKNIFVNHSHKNPHKHAVHYYAQYFFYFFPPYSITAALQDWFAVAQQRGGCDILPTNIRDMCEKNEQQKNVNMEKLYNFVLTHDLRLAQCCKRICENVNTPSCYEMPPLLDMTTESFTDPHLIYDIMSLVFQGFFYWGLLVVSEKRLVGNLVQALLYRFISSQERRMKDEPPKDLKIVKEEVSHLLKEETISNDVVLICQDLTKAYASHMIINNVNMTVKKGECVGLLGGSGSGRSSVIQMLAGQIIPTRGTAYIGKNNLHKNREKYLENIGYCPQVNCLFDTFTGVQMMELIGRIKGIPRSLLAVHIKKWLNIFGLTEAANDRCHTYSFSMKRRLCIALAVVAGNPIYLFDEPTAGFDAAGKQRFWSIVQQLATAGHSIIFASYTVNECSKLGAKMIVLAEGNVQCVGTPAELQARFSKGFTLLVRLKVDDLTPMDMTAAFGRVIEIKRTIEITFKYANLRDEQDNLLFYFLRDTRLTWGQVFNKAEEIKKQHDLVESYSISQANLEDVFVMLTNKFKEIDKPRRIVPLVPGELTKTEAEMAAYESAMTHLAKKT